LVKQPSSFPRRVFCARGLLFASLTRNEGWAEHRETYGRSCEAPVRRVRTRQALVRRLASLVRGTLASRRSTVAILGPGPRFPHRTCVRIGHSEFLAPVRGLPRRAVTSRAPRDATPRSIFKKVALEDTPQEQGCDLCSIAPFCSQAHFLNCSQLHRGVRIEPVLCLKQGQWLNNRDGIHGPSNAVLMPEADREQGWQGCALRHTHCAYEDTSWHSKFTLVRHRSPSTRVRRCSSACQTGRSPGRARKGCTFSTRGWSATGRFT